LSSSNVKVVYHTAIYLFNFILCWTADSKKALLPSLQHAMKALDEVLNDRDLLEDQDDTLVCLLICECRLLYCNKELCTWVEEEFKLFFV
jgi:hypothetical protein